MVQKTELFKFFIFVLVGGGIIFGITQIPIQKVEEKPSPGFFEFEIKIV